MELKELLAEKRRQRLLNEINHLYVLFLIAFFLLRLLFLTVNKNILRKTPYIFFYLQRMKYQHSKTLRNQILCWSVGIVSIHSEHSVIPCGIASTPPWGRAL